MKIKSKKLLALAVLLSGSLFLAACSQQNTSDDQANTSEQVEIKEMEGKDLEFILDNKRKKDKILLVDVRTAEEYAQGHIKDSVNYPLEDVKNDASMFDKYKDMPIILYCNTGKRSGEIAQLLADKGFADVTNAKGVKEYKYDLVKYENITAQEFEAKFGQEDIVIADVRPEDEYKEGHVKGAINVPFDKIDKNLDKLPKDKEIYLYCNTGTKSADLAKILEEKGYNNITNVIEGVKEYDFKDLVKE